MYASPADGSLNARKHSFESKGDGSSLRCIREESARQPDSKRAASAKARPRIANTTFACSALVGGKKKVSGCMIYL